MIKEEKTYAKVMHYILLVLFTGLFGVGFAITGVNFTIYDEHVFLSFTNPFYIALYLLAGWFLFKGLSVLYDKCLVNVKPIVMAAVAAVITYGLALLWIFSSNAVPQSDARILMEFARAINLHEFGEGALGPDDYLVYFPYQYGFVSFLRIVMKIFGPDNVRAIMCVIGLSVPTIVLAGTGIISEIAPKEHRGRSVFFFSVLTVLFVPLYFYSVFIYGDLPFAALSLACIYALLLALRKPGVLSALFFFLSCFLNYAFKSNALIVFTAILIYLAITLFKRDSRRTAVVLAVLTVLSVLSVNVLNKAIYSKYSSPEYDSIPMSATIAMGLNDDNGNAGWCNFYHQITFSENDFDADMTSKVSWGYVRYALSDMAKHPLKGLDFWYRKINLQWNTPLFQSLAMINTHDAEGISKLGAFVYDNTDFQWRLNDYMKAYQIFVYAVMAAVLWLTRKNVTSLKPYLPGISIFGSFLFSIIWEAKTRYIMPAFVMIIVCAAIALPLLQNMAKEKEPALFNDFFKLSDEGVKGEYKGIDLFKWIMALWVVAVHVMPHVDTENVILYRAVDTISLSAVPFFFVASGFLLAERLKNASGYEEKAGIVKKQLFRLLKMYLIWTAVYIPLGIYNDITHHIPIKTVILTFLQRFVFVGEQYNSWMMWYLLSAVYALLFVLLLLKLNVKENTWMLWGVFIYLFACFLDYIATGSLAGTKMDAVISPILRYTVLNGRVLRGLFMLPLGMYLSKFKDCMPVGILLFVAGSLIGLTDLFDPLAIVMTGVGIFMIARALKLPNIGIWKAFRKMSTVIYFIHMYVWSITCIILHIELTRGVVMYVITSVISSLIALMYTVVLWLIAGARKKSEV